MTVSPILRLQRRRQLLVEHDPARPQRAAQEAEGVDVAEVARRHGEDRARCPASVAAGRAASGSTPANGAVAVGGGLGDARLAGRPRGQRARLRR